MPQLALQFQDFTVLLIDDGFGVREPILQTLVLTLKLTFATSVAI
jgi:hypothetical protein